MAQATRRIPLSERLHWNDFIKPWLVRLVFVAIGILVGLYILAPSRARAGDSYLPKSYISIPTGIVGITGPDGASTLLPVRIADSTATRGSGFNGVGVEALDNAFLLFAQSRETTRATNYTMENVRAPLEVAIIDGTGSVIAVRDVPAGTENLSVSENHRWVLAAKRGTFEPYGIVEGSMLDPETVRRVNF